MKKLALLVFVVACGHKTEHGSPPSPPEPADTGPAYDASHLPLGLDVKLSDATQGPPAADHAKPADAKLLADVSPLFARMRPLPSDAPATFALRPASQPPPKPGETIATSFPAPPAPPPPAVQTGELGVVRFSPEGSVPYGSQLSVTFSQPMVALTSQSDAAAVQPVKLSPQPKGHWRWLGTRTIVFDAQPRFPEATAYHVEIPAGTKSATGGVLAHAVEFSFDTPPPALVAHAPNDDEPRPLDAPLFARFDQRIDPATALASVKLKAGRQTIDVRLLTAAEIAATESLRDWTKVQDGEWLAFRATEALPAGATVTVTFASGLASAEGSIKTKAPQSFTFQTRGAFALQSLGCATGCPAGSALALVFDNSIDPKKLDPKLVEVTPPIADMHLVPGGRELALVGNTLPRTRYRVKLGRALTDVFGQTLAKDVDATFDIGDATPTFFGPSGMVVLDPALPSPVLDAYTTNYSQLDVKLYAVTPGDLPSYVTFVNHQWDHDEPPVPPGKLAFAGLVRVPPGPNRLQDTPIDLASALHDKRGDVVAVVVPSPWRGTGAPPRLITWVQATRIAVDAHSDGDKLVAVASDLATGKPLANASVAIEPGHVTATTDATGVATLKLPDAPSNDPPMLVATAGADHAFVTRAAGSWAVPSPARLAWYVVDDRQLYRPGERVALKGWLRIAGRSDVEPVDSSITTVAYRVLDSQNNELAKGTSKLGTLGGFDLTFALPSTPNLGEARVQLNAGGVPFEHDVRVEEFRRPEFTVAAHAGAGPYVVAGHGADVTAVATYYSGGPVAGADVRWHVSASPTTFTPPNRDDYRFGASPWWTREPDDDARPAIAQAWAHDAKTDATGAHVLHADFASVSPASPMTVVAEASVSDLNHQTWSATTSVLVHPSAAYVGMKPRQAFVARGTPFDVDVIGVGIDGKPLPGAKIALRAARLDWEMKDGRYHTKELDPQTCDVIAAQAAQPCHFATATPGTYRLVATITDTRGRPNRSELTYWVAGGPTGTPRADVAMIPDRDTYAVGDTAHVLVAPPFYPAEGLVTWRRSGIVKAERVRFTAPSTIIDVPITDELVPNVFLHVDVVGEAEGLDAHGVADPKLPKRPGFANGDVDLVVPPKTRTLSVAVMPDAPIVVPGGTTAVSVKVIDAAGHPMPGAEVAVMAVDESVLNMAGYTHPSPIDTFYEQRPAGVDDELERAFLRSAPQDDVSRFELTRFRGGEVVDLEQTASISDSFTTMTKEPVTAAKPAAALAEGRFGKKLVDKSENMEMPDPDAGASTGPIAVRSNFDPLATFAPSAITGPDGSARIPIKLPDNLTRYRLVAIAAAGAKQFGKGESTLTAQLPLMVRPSAPRFLNYGDTFRLPITVQNLTDAAMTVKIGVRATNALVTAGAGREVTVPANDRALVEIPMAAELAGTAHVQVVGVAGATSDATELAVPVWTPATTEAFATYGVIDSGSVAQPVALPAHVVPEFGGLEVSTSSTNVASLTDALLYLVHYPFDCAEQRASRIVAIASLKDELAAFHAQGLPSDQALATSMADDLAHLANMQNSDGGFAYWDRGEPSDPYLTIFVIDALERARQKQLAVPDALFAHGKSYLAGIEHYIPDAYGKEARASLVAYTLAVRKRLGDGDIARGQRLIREMGGADKLPIEAAGWLLQLFGGDPKAATERAALVRFALNRATETAGAASFTTSYGESAHLLLASDRRADAVMLEGLIDAQKDSDVIPKIVTGLLGHRSKGRWGTTQENAFVLVALDRYFRTYEKITPDFVARVWLGSDSAGDHKFAGRTIETHQIDIAMADVARHDHTALAIAKDGAGRMYYRIAMTYAPAELKLAPFEAGFTVERHYEGVDDPHDVARTADGAWHIKAGARVRVRVSMVNDSRRYQVALVDPLPAGLEPQNPELVGTPSIPSDSRASWQGTWFEHQNLRDDRAEAFTSLLWEGVHEYTYVARATTPGSFVVPPPKAEEMYAPETFGRGASDRVIVE